MAETTETERRKHVETALADSRLAGMTISRATQAIFDAYIRGEIQACDLVTAYKRMVLGGGYVGQT
jgi:hypothetical protein